MASVLPHHPAQNGASFSRTIRREPSFSSFPSSRTPPSPSLKNDQRSPPTLTQRRSTTTSDSSQRISRRSSHSAAQQISVTHSHSRRIRPQYPANSTENHVEYILVASFDIDRGSVMEHQYPGPISGDEHMLAELMLPDQAHVRSQDWTIFFLHKDTSAEDEANEQPKERKKRRKGRKDKMEIGNAAARDDAQDEGEDRDTNDDVDEESEDDEDMSDDGIVEEPPLIYVLNLVNTKQDTTAKRGAIVKSMAICTRHPFLHIYKPLLLLALEEYFRSPVPATLASLYHAVNSMDLSLMPHLSLAERFILQASDAKDMFIEKFAYLIQERQKAQPTNPTTPTLAPPPLPRDTHEFESRVIYNGIPIPIKIPTTTTPETISSFSLINLITTFSTPHSHSPQPFPLHPHLTTSGPTTHPITLLLNALLTQKRIVFLGHSLPSSSVAEAVLAACALASGSGVLRGFVRHAFPYTDLSKIDDLLRVPGFVAGVTNPAFAGKEEWWDVLCDLGTGRIRVSGKIQEAPVTEGVRFFQAQAAAHAAAHAAATGREREREGPMSATASLAAGLGAQVTGLAHHHHHHHLGLGGGGAPSWAGDAAGDNKFIASVLHSINNRHGEARLRSKMHAHVARFVRLAAAFEEMVYGASALFIGATETDSDSFEYGVAGHGLVWPDEGSRWRELAANASRVEAWRQTRSYFACVGDLARRWERGGGSGVGRGIDFGYQMDRLRVLKLGREQSAAIYLALAKAVEAAGREGEEGEEGGIGEERREVARYDVINQLLLVMPESSGGLFHLSLGLFHPKLDVRLAVVGLLEKIMEHPAGRHFWASLGRFAKLAFFRVKREGEGQGKV